VDGPSYSSYPEEPQTVRDGAVLPTDKRFSCTECGKCFCFISSLNVHKRSHTGEKAYSCPECGKCFHHTSSLYRHQRCHMVEKPYSCSECQRCFVCKSELVRHQRSHKEKAYSCPECEKCFSEKSNLYRHQKSHTGEKPYSCPESPFFTVISDCTRAHIKDPTRGRSHIAFLSEGIGIDRSLIFLYLRVHTPPFQSALVSRVQEICYMNHIFSYIRNLKLGRSTSG
ncbi:hypothetical protein AB205_0127140, partial [Aquarana catesbeiana]